MSAVAESNDGDGRALPLGGRRQWAAYRQANWMLAHAGIALRLAGVPPGAPELVAIRLALRAVNDASGFGRDEEEVTHDPKASEPRFGRRAG